MKTLLHLLARYPYNSSYRAGLMEQLKLTEDWNRLIHLINEHGIIALATYNIKQAGLEDLIPEEAIALLENGRMQSMVRNAWLTERWKEVNRLLTGSGIKHVLLKGMALEYTIYGAQGLRQMNDNDILLKREDALKAWYLLQENGFRPEMVKSTLYKKIILDIGKHLPTLNKDGYSLEIHHRLFGDKALNKNLNDAIDKAEEINIEGTQAYILQKDLHFEYLSKHMLKHMLAGDSQLRLYTDMELLKPGKVIQMPDGFLQNPKQTASLRQRRDAYRANYFSVPRRYRLRYITGDLFPSLIWIKQRHKCSTLAAIIYYPRRLAKLIWLFGKSSEPL